jgi:hypothetical protein
MIASVSNKQLGIGKWTAVANEVLGTVVKFPATTTQGPRTYKYVQYRTDSGVAAHQGSPVGFVATLLTDPAYIVSADVSATGGLVPNGIIVNDSTTAVTDDYYGWIQLAVPGEILKTVLLTSGTANNALVVWETDYNLATATAFNSDVEVIDTPFGVVCTGVGTTTSSVVSTSVTGDVLVILSAYLS